MFPMFTVTTHFLRETQRMQRHYTHTPALGERLAKGGHFLAGRGVPAGDGTGCRRRFSDRFVHMAILEPYGNIEEGL